MNIQAARERGVSRMRLSDGRKVYVRTSSDTKPEIPGFVMDKWQRIIDLLEDVLNMPYAVMLKAGQENLHLLLKNTGPDGPFNKHDKVPLGAGVYCETAIISDKVLHVPDATRDEAWKNGPNAEAGLVSYVGTCLKWPDGEVFGTLCCLGDEPCLLPEKTLDTMALFRAIVETDLELLVEKRDIKNLSEANDVTVRELHHRIKNHLNMITNIMQLGSFLELSTVEDFTKFNEDMEHRIRAVAELHTLLAYGARESLSLADYLGKVVSALVSTVSETGIEVNLLLEPVIVDSRQFMNYGIIINELITNSISHAFQGMDNPRIELSMRKADDDFVLRYKNNGPGLPEPVTIGQAKSIGMQLISNLTEQMRGTLEIDNDSGARFTFVFPCRPC